MSLSKQALLALLLVNLIWGITFPLISLSAHFIDAYSFVALRCMAAVLAMLPFIWRRIHTASGALIQASLLLGFFCSLAFVTQTIGLKTIDPAESAFVTGLNVILVPFFAALLGLGRLKLFNLFCAGLCLVGLYILTGAKFGRIDVGVYWTMACAVFYALFIVYLQKESRAINNPALMTFYQVLGGGLTASMFLLYEPIHIILNATVIIAVLFCGVCATSLAIWLQTRYQRYLRPTTVALIYCLEPIFAALCSFAIVGEPLTLRLLIGGSIIIFSIFLTEYGAINTR